MKRVNQNVNTGSKLSSSNRRFEVLGLLAYVDVHVYSITMQFGDIQWNGHDDINNIHALVWITSLVTTLPYAGNQTVSRDVTLTRVVHFHTHSKSTPQHFRFAR